MDHLWLHEVHCRLCSLNVGSDHMFRKHECVQEKCKPVIATNAKIREWRHDLSCECIPECPLCKFYSCFRGILPDVEKHIREEHKCTQMCRFDAQKTLEYDASCMNGSCADRSWSGRNLENTE